MKKFFRKATIFLLILVAGLFAFTYWGVYDEGIRAGTVVRISRKGVAFKTFEGQLNLATFGAVKRGEPFVETFEFSVEKNNPQIVKELEKVALSGERVNLHYIKRYISYPWRGNTKYFIREVERLSRQTSPVDSSTKSDEHRRPFE